MKNKANEIKTKICIPKGAFGGNCSGCRYWKNIIETQVAEHFVVIMIIGIIHQKDEVALLMKETGNKVSP